MKKVDNHKLYRKMGFYEKYVKRAIDIFCSGLAIIVFCWLYVIIALLVRIKLGSPVLFTQYRPGLIDPKTGKEQIFKMYKFRTMTDKKDAEGNLLPDKVRLTKFGAWLRSTSLDELPEAFCILNGTMTIIGPRPQLVRDMVFMSDEQRMRHTAKPGLSGLAQVSGRNAISWNKKLQYDLDYIKHVSFGHDLKILFKTVEKAFIKQEGITEEGSVTAADYGDYLLQTKQITREEYEKKKNEAKEILKGLM
nr:sugar transferase [uncultured Lachnoanaerobaculum sp.]